MKNLSTTIIISLFALSGCASLITHGEVSNGDYISNSAGYSITPATGWHATTTAPSPDLEANISSKLTRAREIGYLIKNDGSAIVMIETHGLTWGGKPILTIDVTWDKAGPEKFNKACEEFADRERNRASSNFASFTSHCAPLILHKPCEVSAPCLELSKEMVSSRKEGAVMLERSYIFDDEGFVDMMINKASTANGWRVHFTLSSPPDDYQRNKETLGQLISTMRKTE